MARCKTCGNDYKALAPACSACDAIFCCNHCAEAQGITGLRDRA